ncbi:MAG TPA: hypothetical protein ENJ30_07155 [Desulfobulbaceae bacterium]|nr:hypothetical protein [Desulfobulbaceae bacterium]
MKSLNRQDIQQLVKTLAGNTATEELIAFVADNDGMLRSCRIFLSTLQGENDFPGWFRHACQQRKLDPERVVKEIRRLLQIFRPEDTRDEELYTVLGLAPDATLAEVKKAFRHLSRLYHPDSSSSGSGDSARFIAVCQAYKTILAKEANKQDQRQNRGSAGPWIYRKKRDPFSEQKKKYIILVSTLSVALGVVSILAPFIYKKHVMLSQFAAQRELPREQKVQQDNTSASPEDNTSWKEQSDNLQADVDVAPSGRVQQAERKTGIVSKERVSTDDVDKVLLADNTATGRPECQESRQPEAARKVSGNNGVFFQERGRGIARETVSASVQMQSDEEQGRDFQKIKNAQDREVNESTPNKGSSQPIASTSTLKPGRSLHETGERIGKKSNTTKAAEKTDTKVPMQAGKILARKVRKEDLVNTSAKREKQLPRSRSLSDAATLITAGKTQAELADELLRLRLLSFLEAYTASYEHKDLRTFSSYFTQDAIENGAPFQSRRKDYERLFARVNTIAFTIIPDSWTRMANRVRFHGRFNAEFRYREGKNIILHGKINLLLEDTTDSLKVKDLSYRFDK